MVERAWARHDHFLRVPPAGSATAAVERFYREVQGGLRFYRGQRKSTLRPTFESNGLFRIFMRLHFYGELMKIPTFCTYPTYCCKDTTTMLRSKASNTQP